MTHKIYLLVIAVVSLLSGCTKENQQITNPQDYRSFLDIEDNKSLAFARAERSFWESKFNSTPSQFTYLAPLAASHTVLFEVTGDIKELKTSEKYLIEANENVGFKKAGLLRALAKNYITQHRFNEALELLKKAYVLGEKKQATQKMLFDVYLELGDNVNAEKNLTGIKDFNDFDYLIRLSKWQDHKGDLDAAIRFMEKAKSKAEKLKNKELMLWSYSNLADFYGHAGKIDASYQHYLKALSLDPNYTYALGRIAWIVFSHEKNTIEANKIVDVIISKHNTPDLQLFKAELATFEGDHKAKKVHLQNYFKLTDTSDYGDMYNSYHTLLYAEDFDYLDLALGIANKEIENRPTPGSYDLLSWVYYKKGNVKKALQVVQEYMEGNTFEPAILYHMAEIYKANKMEQKVQSIKKELLGSLYELGPNMAANIHKL